jgi:hypothetical protein
VTPVQAKLSNAQLGALKHPNITSQAYMHHRGDVQWWQKKKVTGFKNVTTVYMHPQYTATSKMCIQLLTLYSKLTRPHCGSATHALKL